MASTRVTQTLARYRPAVALGLYMCGPVRADLRGVGLGKRRLSHVGRGRDIQVQGTFGIGASYPRHGNHIGAAGRQVDPHSLERFGVRFDGDYVTCRPPSGRPSAE